MNGPLPARSIHIDIKKAGKRGNPARRKTRHVCVSCSTPPRFFGSRAPYAPDQSNRHAFAKLKARFRKAAGQTMANHPAAASEAALVAFLTSSPLPGAETTLPTLDAMQHDRLLLQPSNCPSAALANRLSAPPRVRRGPRGAPASQANAAIWADHRSD